MYVEFYFPGLSLEGSNEREVKSRSPEQVTSYPAYAYAYRFFDKHSDGKKVNFSNFYYIGEEYTKERYIKAFPQGEDFEASRIVKLITGSFRPLKEDDVVVA